MTAAPKTHHTLVSIRAAKVGSVDGVQSAHGLPPELVPPVTAMRHAGRSPELLVLFAAYNASVATAVEANRGRDRRDRLRDALVVRDGAAS